MSDKTTGITVMSYIVGRLKDTDENTATVLLNKLLQTAKNNKVERNVLEYSINRLYLSLSFKRAIARKIQQFYTQHNLIQSVITKN